MKVNNIRYEIDRIDAEIIELLSKRSCLVSEAEKTKNNKHDVRDKTKVDEAIVKIKRKAEKAGLDPNIAASIYRNILNCFDQKEMTEFMDYNYELQDI